MDGWRQIVSRDAAIIGAALDRVPVQPYLRARFPAGCGVVHPGCGPGPLRRGGVRGRRQGENRLARAMQRDLRPAARIIAEALRTHDWKAARKQLAGALKECGTESAEALEREMRAAGKKAWPETHAEAQRGGGAEGMANSGTIEGARKGWDTRRRNGWTPKQYEENKAKVDSLVDDLGKTGPGGKGKGWKNREESFGGLDAGTISDIKKANPRMNVDGSEAIVDTAQLHHAMKEHGPGKEKHPAQIPITHEDLKRIPDVLSDYDSISPGKGPAEGKWEEAVVFRKAYPDGTIACVELDQYSEKRKSAC
ncbi:MAG: hypothetical protein IKQ55_04095 [Kiritimatiellae bacterium]|nr:hypothetical protein [Kiritimatiellia bacterium]